MRLTRVFLDIHLGQNFQGLNTIAKKAKTPCDESTTLLFINKAMTAFKVLRGKDYLVYYKNGNRRIPMDAIQYLPKQFTGSETEMTGAIRESLLKSMAP